MDISWDPMMNLGSGSLKFTAWGATLLSFHHSNSEDVSFGLQVGSPVFSPRIAENSVRKQPSIFQSWVTPTRMVGPSMRFAIVGWAKLSDISSQKVDHATSCHTVGWGVLKSAFHHLLPYSGDLPTMVIDHLQVMGWSSKYTWMSQEVSKWLANRS